MYLNMTTVVEIYYLLNYCPTFTFLLPFADSVYRLEEGLIKWALGLNFGKLSL